LANTGRIAFTEMFADPPAEVVVSWVLHPSVAPTRVACSARGPRTLPRALPRTRSDADHVDVQPHRRRTCRRLHHPFDSTDPVRGVRAVAAGSTGLRRRAALAVMAVLFTGIGWMNPGLGLVGGLTPRAAAAPTSGDISALLAQVQVVDRIQPQPGYERGCKKGQGCVFGPAWNDPSDRSGCDTRNRLLATALNDVVFKDGTRQCKVTSGWEIDPYSGQRIELHDIQIDHIVPLKRAWDDGAWAWDLLRRRTFANDLSELIAVSAQSNDAKSDSGLDEWLPPNATERCPYVIRYLTVAVNYQLPITTGEREAAMAACNGQV
jgi:hypothetical protein